MGRAHFRAKFGLSTLYFSIVDTLFFAQNLGDNPHNEYICEETGDEVILMKDKTGRVIGFEKLNFTVAKPGPVRVAFETVTA